MRYISFIGLFCVKLSYTYYICNVIYVQIPVKSGNCDKVAISKKKMKTSLESLLFLEVF